jgi:outer membrane receptor protein involved in Fe transport
MLYFVYSEGFRLGGSNSPRAVNAGVGIPAEYGPDTMQNYELGFKSLWFDSRFEFNVDLFLMQWDDIQIYARNDESPWWVSGIFNGNTAEQTGIELAMSWQATDRLKLDASAFFADPEFTEDTFLPRDDPDDPTIRDGETMPNSPERNLWFRYDSSYQSSTYNTITNALEKDPDGLLPSSQSASLQAGLALDSGWDVSMIMRNVWDEPNVTYVGSAIYTGPDTIYPDDDRFKFRTLQKPRTVGLQVRKRF